MPSFGPYELLQRIGAGGMGELFLARLAREDCFEKRLALKRILPHLSQDPTFIQRFRQEASTAAHLNHQNIVQIFDFGQSDGHSFIAMEFVDGLDADALLQRNGPLALPISLTILHNALRGLDYAHRAADALGNPLHLVHGDVAPKNLLLSREGEIKWIDFGLATFHQATPQGVAGTIPYMSPEQALGQPLDPRADLFSLAVSFYELLTQRKPFPAATSPATHAAAVTHCQPQLTAILCQSPLADYPDLRQLIATCLDHRPAQRPDAARTLINALEALHPLPMASPDAIATLVCTHHRPTLAIDPCEPTLVSDEPIARHTPSPAPPRPSSRKKRLLLGSTCLGLLSLVAALWLSLGLLETAPPIIPPPQAQPLPAIELTTDPPHTTAVIIAASPSLYLITAHHPNGGTLKQRLWLAPQAQTPTAHLRLPPHPATLYVTLEPPTASFTLDGQAQPANTPLRLAPGTYTLNATAPNATHLNHSLHLDSGQQAHTQILLSPARATLNLQSSADHATLRLTEHTTGLTHHCPPPCTLSQLTPGAYAIDLLTAAGHACAQRQVQLMPGAVKQLELNCDPPTAPTAAPATTSPGVHLQARGGTIRSGGSSRDQRQLSLPQGTFVFNAHSGKTRLFATLHRLESGYAISMRVEPWAELTLNGQSIPSPVTYHPLSQGNNTLRIKSGDSPNGIDLRVRN